MENYAADNKVLTVRTDGLEPAAVARKIARSLGVAGTLGIT